MNIFEQLKEKGYILFFNQGDRCVFEFISPVNRPSFFWYYDSFYSHLPLLKQDRYLHIFVKKKEDYNFSFMQDNKTWDDVYNYYLDVKEKRSKDIPTNDPPILRSPDTMIPELIFDFEKEGNNEAVCIFPDKYKGIRCKFFDDNHKPIDLIEIPELMEIINNIVE